VPPDQRVPLASRAGRGIVVATALGSGIAFLDGSVVNVALPAIKRDLGGGLTAQQWVVDGYLLSLSALLLLGGALGDRYGRKRVYVIGLAGFSLASLLCGLSPTPGLLVAARLIQGIAGALLVPGSLALIDASIDSDDRGRAVGVWAGLSGVSGALGPFLGGWLVDAASWRWVFFINLPLAVAAVWTTMRFIPESRDPHAAGLDLYGAALVTAGLSGSVFALIQVPAHGWSAASVVAVVIGALGLLLLVPVEERREHPMVPTEVFRSGQFDGVQLTTLVVYAALSGAFFLVPLQLQETMRYSAMKAGLALIPMTFITMLLSPRMGALGQRIGPRLPMTVGPMVLAGGILLLSRINPGTSYVSAALPGVIVTGLGLSITVAPLTAAVFASVPEEQAGVASGVNNAVARAAGLLAVAVLPVVAGINTSSGGLRHGFGRAMYISAAIAAVGGVVAWLTVRTGEPVLFHRHPALTQACAHPCTRIHVHESLADATVDSLS
jgi:EmrB/QacA subfamily drug resistance transporter